MFNHRTVLKGCSSFRHIAKMVVIVQRFIPKYRRLLFERISKQVDTRVIFSHPSSSSKVSADSKVPHYGILLKKRDIFHNFFKQGSDHPIIQADLWKTIRRLRPSALITEGLSHPQAVLMSLIYKRLFGKRCNAVIWSIFYMPVNESEALYLSFYEKIRQNLKSQLRNFIISKFDYFIAYSTFGKKQLVRLHHVDPKKIFVNVNLSSKLADVTKPVEEIVRARKFDDSKCLDLLYVGFLSKEKKIVDLIESITRLGSKFQLMFRLRVVGDGPEKSLVREYAERFKCVEYIAYVDDDRFMNSLYCSSDFVLLPGRGGMVMSEALSWGCRVLCVACDGVEYDLITSPNNGRILPSIDCMVEHTSSIDEISLNSLRELETVSEVVNSIRRLQCQRESSLNDFFSGQIFQTPSP